MIDKYLMVGAGGTGTHLLDPVLRYLANKYGNSDPMVWQFGVVDGDSIEPKNLERQLFAPQDIMSNKAIAAVRPHEHFGNVSAIPEYLGQHNIPRFITDGTTVFIAVDNFKVRSLIEKYCLTLQDCVVINGGNELSTGSCQIWLRKGGANITPPLSFLHPEIEMEDGDRSTMSCADIAKLPGGGQIIAVNAMSAVTMLTALINVHRGEITWTEAQFDLFSGTIQRNGETIPLPISTAMDNRDLRGWRPEAVGS